MKRLLAPARWPDARFLAALVAVLLLLAGVAGALLAQSDLQRQRLEQTQAHARILAASVTAALAFSAKKVAEEAVQSLFADPAVRAVGIYDPDGAAILRQASNGGRAPDRLAADLVPSLIDGQAVATAQVRQKVILLGRVYVALAAELGPARWMRYVGPGLLILMAIAMVAGVSASQHELSLAHRRLAERAEELAKANAQLIDEMAERKKAQAALAQAQKMEAIGQLTGGLAHDFNNLLAAVSGGLRLLEKQEDPSRRAAVRAALNDAVNRGARLTRQLVSVARGQSLQVRVIDAFARIENLRDLLQRSVGEDIVIDLGQAGPEARVAVDPDQLDLVVLNLAVNARDAMPRGGSLRVDVDCDPAHGADGQVHISVSDTGEGMSVETMERAFEPFFTTKDVGKGSGLGLAQVYAFARQSGGQARIESSPGKGTTIHIDLPRAPLSAGELAETPTPPTASEEPPPGEGQRVLLVEDDDVVGEMVGQLLEAHGYVCVRAASADAAISSLETDRFDLVFSDIVMPGGRDGVELARDVRSRWPDIPVLLTTGYSGKAHMRAGEFEVVYKPWRPSDLLRHFHAALEARR